MADLAPGLISIIVTNLSKQALGEFGITSGTSGTELEKLSHTFDTIQAVLYYAEVKQWNNGREGEVVKTWLRQLKDAAYDADDVLDEFDIKVQKGLKNHVRSFFSTHYSPIDFHAEMAGKLNSAREKLDAIYERRPLGLQVGSISSPQGVLEWRLTTSLVDDSEICGRVDQKAELIDDLVSSSDALSVHALCGIGGLGKTTLAQLVFNAETIKMHFHLRIWVCVSDDTDMRLTRAIIESIEGNTDSNERQLDPLERRLLETLGGKRFLLVLDDVWEDFPDKWDRSKNAIRSNTPGSVVLITTRIQQVAEKVATVPIRHMKRLSEDDSWSLFALHAFRMGKVEEHEHLKTIGKCIVKKCGGVPLVLKVLGSLMQLKKQEKEWLDVMESELWDLAEEGEKLLATMRLSYTHLPMNLRQCFSYCCIFPKDYRMEKGELIQIWMANGFISCGERKDLHERGQEIFSELVARSFFQNVEVDYLGNITCKMHDLLHDVATSVMKHELHLIQPGGSLNGAKNCRHVSYSAEIKKFGTLMKGNSKIPSLRSFFYMPEGHDWSINYGKDVVEWLSGKKYLRILRLCCLNLEKLPVPLSKHLRYLDVSRSLIKRLPESTSSLHKLQTLNLSFCIYLEQLPKGMKEMKSLVYLDIRGCSALKGMPPGMGQLKGMRKLSKFIVGKKDGCKIGNLEELNGLEGELSISGLCNVKSVADFKSANLMEKNMLTSLELIAATMFEENSCIDVKALSVLQPHQNLRKLLIRGYGSLELPDWMMDLHVHLPNLVEITLTGFSQCQQLPIPLGRLDSLKVLGLGDMCSLEHIGVEVYGDGERAAFPSLENLTLYGMRSLKEWAEITTSASSRRAASPFPCLHQLSIEGCPLLTKFPIIPSVQDLFISGSTSQLTELKELNGLQEFSLQELLESTDNFSKDRKIGTGRFGVVYHGVLQDGREVAIKRAAYATGTRRQEDKDNAFINELESLSRLHHKNLVRLLGFYDDSNERILVYEFMQNGSLHDHLHKIQGSPLMSWTTRIKVALDAARGIEYLHEYAVPRIIHRDIKSSNILLDLNWTAKVSDFGLSLMGPEHIESHLSLWPAGTVGYVDPEYYRLQQLTTKSDVYSFGVLLLEILSGQKGIHKNENGVPRNVVDYIVPYIVQDEIHRVLDKRVPPPTLSEIEAVIYIGYLAADCVTLEGRDRPSMSDIVNSLDKALNSASEMNHVFGTYIGDKDTSQTQGSSSLPKSKGHSASPKIDGHPMSVEPKLKVEISVHRMVPKILQFLGDDKTRTIGLYGQGGIGKTFILKALAKVLEADTQFDIIIWAQLSRNWSTRNIQNAVLRQLALGQAHLETDEVIAKRLFQALEKKKFLLIADDVWERIDFNRVGIPVDKGKLIVSTTSSDVCLDMAANVVIKFDALTKEDSWELFREQVGEVVDDPIVRSTAQRIVDDCGGLPLLLVATGKALADESSVDVWSHTLKEFILLKPLDGREALLQKLKISYQRLKVHGRKSPRLRDCDIQTCFLYCALFQEDYREINISELVNYWFQEGLTGVIIKDALEKGHDVIEVLTSRALIERTENGSGIKMHEVMRDLASVILSEVASDCQFLVRASGNVDVGQSDSPPRSIGSEKSLKLPSPEIHRCLFKAAAELTKPPPEREWEPANLIFLMDNKLSSLPEKPNCPQLSNLFLQRNPALRKIPMSFFERMPNLKVMNLSKTSINSIPKSISKLASLQCLNLRGCIRLFKLPPEVGELNHLQLLLLFGTFINQLPEQIGKLSSLKELEVSFYGPVDYSEYSMLPPELIPPGVIAKLLSLKNLSIDVQPGDLRWKKNSSSVMKEMFNLDNLTGLSFYAPEGYDLQLHLLESLLWKEERLRKFNFVVGHDVKRLLVRVPQEVELKYNQQDRCLRFVNAKTVPEEIKAVLTRTTAFYLDHNLEVRSLSEFGVENINGLKFCILRECPEIETIVDGEEGALPWLEHLSIHYLEKLEMIWKNPVLAGSFGNLRYLQVSTCLRLNFVMTTSTSFCLYSLVEIVVEDCQAIKEIIHEDSSVEPEIVVLPMLERLTLRHLPNLVSIFPTLSDGLRHLTALQELHLYACPKMTSLPENIQHLTALTTLNIIDCPDLERRCDMARGVDWHMIAHIPTIWINGKQVTKDGLLSFDEQQRTQLHQKPYMMLTKHRFPHAKSSGYFIVLLLLVAFCVRHVTGALRARVRKELGRQVSDKPKRRMRRRNVLRDTEEKDDLDLE